MTRLADTMTETDLKDSVIELATRLGLLVHHCRPALTAKGWRTPIQGHKGFPDLVIVGHRGVLYRELKAANGRVSPEQAKWLLTLHTAGQDVAEWRPADWPRRIEAELRSVA